MQKILKATDPSVGIIYISTDAVFPSSLHMAKHTDCTQPESVYGKSKELAEFFLLNSDRKYTIIRTTIVGLNENKSKSFKKIPPKYQNMILVASSTGQVT